MLALDCTTKHSHQLAQLANLLLSDALINGIAFHQIVLDYLTSPDTKSSTPFAFDAITDGDDDIEVIKGNWLFHSINV